MPFIGCFSFAGKQKSEVAQSLNFSRESRDEIDGQLLFHVIRHFYLDFKAHTEMTPLPRLFQLLGALCIHLFGPQNKSRQHKAHEVFLNTTSTRYNLTVSDPFGFWEVQ